MNSKFQLDDFFAFINTQRKFYRTKNIILTMGGDFTYQDANVYLKNLDKVIRFILINVHASNQFILFQIYLNFC